MSTPLRVLVAGCGHMGASHAAAYHTLDGYEIAGLVARSAARRGPLAERLGGPPQFDDFYAALRETKPDVVSINTYPDTHAEYALASIEAGAHLFVEKPIATTVAAAQAIVDAAAARGRKMVVGYILRVHPSWQKFVELARGLGKPLVMRMNLNQQSQGENWRTHQALISAMAPIVDCGVHYVDVMCLMTGARPTRVSAIQARLTDDLPAGRPNYGMLQVAFDDGSVGWYEAGWGPMMSETAHFVKDVVGPRGSVSITGHKSSRADQGAGSDNVDDHTKTESLLLHHSELAADGRFARPDEVINLADEPTHNDLCRREQQLLLDAIREDRDLSDHWRDAVNSLRIVLAADEAARTGKAVEL
ncbi:MAG: Gfo/Idh/MocA family oxidoreductase [Planctomycetota bacterium]